MGAGKGGGAIAREEALVAQSQGYPQVLGDPANPRRPLYHRRQDPAKGSSTLDWKAPVMRETGSRLPPTGGGPAGAAPPGGAPPPSGVALYR